MISQECLEPTKIKPQNLHDWGSESAIGPINPLVYIQESSMATLSCVSG
jgi:hypothetical protein